MARTFLNIKQSTRDLIDGVKNPRESYDSFFSKLIGEKVYNQCLQQEAKK